MDVCVVVPNWNGEDWLVKCLDSLRKQSITISIIVVENGSTDGSRELLAAYNDVTVLMQPTNLGFAEGVNVGIRYAIDKRATYVLLFNNDAVADKDWAKHLVSAAIDFPEAGIVTPKLLRDDRKRLDSTGDFYTIYGLPFPRGRDEIDEGQYDDSLWVFGASGGASLYRTSMLREIGLFDKDFFAYFEDVDISFRAQLAGWKVLYNPKSRAYHRVSATSSRLGDFSIYQTAKNFPYVYIKNMPGRLFFLYLPYVLYWYTRMFAARSIRGGSIAFIRGLLESIIHFPKKFFERRYIQKNRKVTTSYIKSILYPARPPILKHSDNPAKKGKA